MKSLIADNKIADRQLASVKQFRNSILSKEFKKENFIPFSTASEVPFPTSCKGSTKSNSTSVSMPTQINQQKE
jgi:hypothetical protein